MNDSAKISALSDLIFTIVQNAKKGVTSPKEKTQARKVLESMLGRKASSAEVNSVMSI